MTMRFWLVSVVLVIGGFFGCVAKQDDTPNLTSQNGLNVFLHPTGLQFRLFRQLPPASTPTSTTHLPQPQNTTAPAPTTPPTSPASPPAPPRTDELTISFAELREVDADGNKVKQGNNEHSFKKFDSQNFNLSQVSNIQIPNSNPAIQASCLNVDGTLSGTSSHIHVVICVTKNDGTIVLADETTTLTAGQLKFSVEIDHWQWCNQTCSPSNPGAFLELDIIFKLPPGRAVKEMANPATGTERRSKRFSYGKDAFANFSTKIQVDGEWMNMSTGFPKLSMTGALNTITVRFPRFNTNVTYDPTVDPGSTPSDANGDGGSVGGASAPSVAQLGLWFSVIVMASILRGHWFFNHHSVF